jgi:Holliday junction resolvase RusA-like endonuclease
VLAPEDRSGVGVVMEFFLSCVPPTASHHQKRIVKRGQFASLADKPALVSAKQMIDTLLLAHRPPAPMTGPLALTLEYTWPWRASDSKRVRARGRIPRETRPDCSNLAKTTEDRLVALRFLEDDGQVVELTVRKFFGNDAGIRVRLAAADASSLFTGKDSDVTATV